MSRRASGASNSSSSHSLETLDSLEDIQSPQNFRGENVPKKENLGLARTVSSINVGEDDGIISIIKKTLTNRRTNDEDEGVDYSQFQESNLYGKDLNSDEINLQRTKTKVSIINTLESRVNRELTNLEKGGVNDVESLKEKPKSMYEGVEREEAFPTKNDGTEFQAADPELVTWDGDDDPLNPRNWSAKKKWMSTAIVAIYTLLSPMTSTILSPAVSVISEEFGVTNESVPGLMVSIFILAWALAPPLVAPLSEMYGRKVVLDVSVWFMFFFNIGCALSKTTAQLCVFRFFAGLGGCAPICIGGGVLGDLFSNEERGLALSLYSLGPTVGPCVSALIAGYIVEFVSWRWVFWVLCIFNGVVAILGNLVLRETYAPTLLKRKAAKLRKITGNQNLHSLYEIDTGETSLDKVYTNLARPIVMLFTNPMVFGLGVFMAICYGCLYILIVAFPAVWGNIYHFNKGSIGLMYLSLLIGYLNGTLFFQIAVEIVKNYLTKRNNGVYKPEFKLPLLLVSGLVLPVGLFWFGWSAQHHIQFMMPAVGAALFAFGLIAVFYCIQSYLIEMNPRFSASAIAAASIFRSFMGFVFPLFCTQMFDGIGYGWGCTIFGFIGLATGLPFPLFVTLYGENLRIWANKRTEKAQAKRDAKYLARLKKKEEEKARLEEESKPRDSISQSS